MSDPKLTMSFEANTIKHLGVQMYSTIPPALAEMIANSYDACAKTVEIKLYDQGEKKIIVKDTGDGMTFDEVNQFFLRIGRNRREEGQVASCDRIATGKKGLGKLALFGIGDVITISTVKKGECVEFTMDWNKILNWKGGPYEPEFVLSSCENQPSGTTITLKNLKRKSDFSEVEYAISLSKLFNFLDKDFTVTINLNDGDSITIDNKLKYENIKPEFTWDIKEIKALSQKEYENSTEIEGEIITTEKPLRPGLRGITLFANGRMVNFPEFFGQSESSHFFSYTTGWLNVDFIDNWPDDVISTNRQSIDWENEKTIPLREYLASLLLITEKEWRDKRKVTKQNIIKEKTKIDVEKWYSALPSEVQQKVETIVNLLDNSPELSEQTQQTAIETIHELIPEYPKYHWRHLNRNIHTVSRDDYERGDFLRAAEEAIKLYEVQVKDKGGLAEVGVSLMSRSFGENNEPLKITNNITESDKNIERGQKHMSMGIMAGFRNPAMHEPKNHVYPAIFDDNDCLDLLSMISYLFKNLDKARKVT